MAALLPLLMLLAAPPAASPPPAAWSPDAIVWQRTNPDGTRFALLEGVRDQPGVAFTYAFFIPAGVWDGAHRHSATARVFVAKGTLRLGYGEHLEHGAATAFPAGSMLIVPAGARHFDGATEDTIIIGTATGPWTTDYADSAAPPSAGTPR